MLGRFAKSMAGLSVVTGSFVGIEHYFTGKSWKNNHPLIDEVITLVQKDEEIVRKTGLPILRTGDVSGILEKDKNWANFSFDIQGPDISLKVSLLADSSEEESKERFVQDDMKNLSFFEKIKNYVLQREPPAPQHWQIISLHVKFQESASYPLIADGIRSHADLRALSRIDSQSVIGEERQTLEVPNHERRRNETLQRARKRTWYIFIASSICLVLGLFGRRYFKVYPVSNGIFVNTVIEKVRSVPAISQELGANIRHMENVRGKLNYNMTKANANIILYGDKGFGRAQAIGKYDKAEQQWNITHLSFESKNTTIDLLKEVSQKNI